MSGWPDEPFEPPPPYTPGDAPPPISRGRYRTDPRLTPRHHIVPQHRGIPFDVLTIVSRYLADIAPVSLASLALTCRRIYQVVLPHLYRSITINRNSLPKILYGVELPRPRNYLSIRPDGTLPPKGIPPDVLKRRTEAFRLVEEVVVDGFVPDVWYSESLAALQPPERILFPNARRLYISAEVLVGCIHWGMVDRTVSPDHSHPVLLALRRTLVPDHVEISSGIMETAGLSDRLKWRGFNTIVDSARKHLERLFAGWKLDILVYHGLTDEWLGCAEDCKKVVLHYVSPKHGGGFGEHSKAERIERIRGIMQELKRLEGTRLVVVAHGPMPWARPPDVEMQDREGVSKMSKGKSKAEDQFGSQDREDQDRWRRHIQQRILLADPHALDSLEKVLELVDWYTSSRSKRLSPKEKAAIGLGPKCRCFRPPEVEAISTGLQESHLEEVGITDGRASEGVTRFVWRPGKKS